MSSTKENLKQRNVPKNAAEGKEAAQEAGGALLANAQETAREYADKAQVLAKDAIGRGSEVYGQAKREVTNQVRLHPMLLTGILVLAAFSIGLGASMVATRFGYIGSSYAYNRNPSHREAHAALEVLLNRVENAKSSAYDSLHIDGLKHLGGAAGLAASAAKGAAKTSANAAIDSAKMQAKVAGEAATLAKKAASGGLGNLIPDSLRDPVQQAYDGIFHHRTTAEKVGLKGEGAIKGPIHQAEDDLAALLYAAAGKIRAQKD